MVDTKHQRSLQVMANEEGTAHFYKQIFANCDVIYGSVTSGVACVCPLDRGATNGDSPVQRLLLPRTVWSQRVALPGMGALSRWYISPKAIYLPESDSEQVP